MPKGIVTMTCVLYTSQFGSAWCEEACLPAFTLGMFANVNSGHISCRYAENQDLVNKNSSVIKEQADVIAALEDRLSKQPGPVSNKSVKNDKKQIKELEADVENLKVLIALLCYATPCHAMPCYALPCCAMQCFIHVCAFHSSHGCSVELEPT